MPGIPRQKSAGDLAAPEAVVTPTGMTAPEPAGTAPVPAGPIPSELNPAGPGPRGPVRSVLVCDDRPELREAIGKVLADVERFEVVGEAADRAGCLEQVNRIRPDVLILDVGIPGGGPDVVRHVRSLHPAIHILVFSGRQDRRVQQEMLTAGADQYVVKTGRLRPLIEALDRACAPSTAGSEPR